MKTYIIGTASGNYEWESKKKELIEVISEFMEKTEEEDLAFGFFISILLKGDSEENETFIKTSAVLANIGDYKLAAELDDLALEIIKRHDS